MCPGEHLPTPDGGRRRFLSGAITAIQGAIGATLAFLLGGAVDVAGLRHAPRELVAGGRARRSAR